MGLSQEAAAALAGLSRVTVNQLENGTLHNLSSTRIEQLANEFGFAIGLVGTRRPPGKSALEAAARVASVPYANELPVAVLAQSIRDGAVAPAYVPHLRTLLQEAPVAILADVVDELEREQEAPRRETWKRMRILAHALRCDRRLWQSTPT